MYDLQLLSIRAVHNTKGLHHMAKRKDDGLTMLLVALMTEQADLDERVANTRALVAVLGKEHGIRLPYPPEA